MIKTTIQGSASTLLIRAVELEKKGNYANALICYQEGIQLLFDSIKETPEKDRPKLRAKIKEYIDHAENLKSFVDKQKEAGKYHEQIHIANGSVGHSYEQIFKPFLDSSITLIDIEDPYIRAGHQVQNLLRFCELVTQKCSNLKTIHLTTGLDEKEQQSQNRFLQQLKESLSSHGVTLEVTYSSTLHDREIRFNNGWIIKIGRGLDIYKPPASKFSLGFFDLNLRPCHETTVDIFHRKHSKISEALPSKR